MVHIQTLVIRSCWDTQPILNTLDSEVSNILNGVRYQDLERT